MIWRLQILGGATVLGAQNKPVRFRSRSALALLVYVALHDGPVQRHTAEGLLWPASDPERQSQNFRRALADLREVLEPGDLRGTILDSTRESLALVAGSMEVDAAEFRAAALQGLIGGPEASLIASADLYRDVLWPDAADDWIYAYRDELEELYAQVVDDLSERWVCSGRSREAIRLGRAAVLKAPMREEVYASLVRAYAASGMGVEAIRQFETLEAMLDEHWGESPSARSRAALETPASVTHPAIVEMGETALTPGGALVPTSEHYIERQTDKQAADAIRSHESVVLIHGPRQVGKTSLLARSLVKARSDGHAVVLSDFQSLSETQVRDVERLYRTLADQLVRGIGIQLDSTAAWNPWLGPNSNLDSLVQRALTEIERPVLWAMDEADRLFGHDCSNDFFGLVRSWHNRRALDPGGPWSKLTVAITYATDAHLFITDLNQSPFNIGVRLRLSDFDLERVQELNRRLGSPASTTDVERVFELTNGQPFLSRRALEFLSTSGTVAELEAIATQDDGPFGEHLRRLGHVVSQDHSIHAAIGQLLVGEDIPDKRTRSRLISGGVAKEVGKEIAFRVPLYGLYLRSGASN